MKNKIENPNRKAELKIDIELENQKRILKRKIENRALSIDH